MQHYAYIGNFISVLLLNRLLIFFNSVLYTKLVVNLLPVGTGQAEGLPPSSLVSLL